MIYKHRIVFLCSLVFAQSLYSMEKQIDKPSRVVSSQKRKKSLSLSTKNLPIIPYKQNTPKQYDHDTVSISATTSSESLESCQTLQSTKYSSLSRSKTVDNPSTKPKEPNLLASSISVLERIYHSPRVKTPKNNQPNDINILVNAVRNYDLDSIQMCIDKPEIDLNQKDQWNNTALHHAVLLAKNQINNIDIIQKMIGLLLSDPRTNSSLTNNDNHMASQLLKGGECPTLRTILFARNSLDIAINNEIGKFLFNFYTNNESPHDEQIKQIAIKIISEIRSIESTQEKNDRALPPESKLPKYVTDDFVFIMLKNRIPSESAHITEQQKTVLKKIFSQEAEMFLLGAMNKESIEISKANINKAINTDKSFAYLIPFMQYVFHALEQHAEEKRPKKQDLLANMIPQNRKDFL